MSMSLKTHTAYSEIQVAQAFDWVLADRAGRVTDPKTIPEWADVDVAYPWTVRILTQEGDVLESFTGDADSRDAAVVAAVTEVEAVADGYLLPEQTAAGETE